MGEATSLTLAAAGYKICGIHLDFRAALTHVEEVKAGIEAAGSEALFININAAETRSAPGARRLSPSTARARRPRAVRPDRHALPGVRIALPSLADDPKDGVDRKKMTMTRTSWPTAS